MKQTIHFWNSVKFSYAAILLTGAVILLGLSLFSQASISQQSRLLYADRQTQRLANFKEILALKSQTDIEFVNEDTYWDDMVTYANKPTEAFSSINLEPELDLRHVNAIWVYNKQMQLVSTITNFPASAKTTSLNYGPNELRTIFANTYRKHYYQHTKLGLMEIYASTIQPSSDVDRKTPAQGYFFMARTLNDKTVQELAGQTSDTVRLANTPDTATKQAPFEPNSGKVTFSVDLNNYQNQPIAQYRATSTSNSITQIVNLARRLVIINSIVYALVCLLLFLSFMKIIARPLSAIYKALERENPRHTKSLEGKASEFGKIASLISATFEQRKQLNDTVKAMSKAQESLRARSEEVEKTNQLMIGRELRMIELKKELAELRKTTKKGDAQS